MGSKVTFHSAKVEQETLALPAGILASFLRIAELIEEFSPNLGRPHTTPLGGGLFEIRAKDREGIARSVFLYGEGTGNRCPDHCGQEGQQNSAASHGNGAQTHEGGPGQ